MSSAKSGKSLAFRLNAWYAAIFLGSFALLLLVADRVVESSLAEADREAIASELVEQKRGWARDGVSGVAAAASERAEQTERGWFVRVSTQRNQTLYVRRPRSSAGLDDEALAVDVSRREIVWQTIVATDRTTWTIAAAPLDTDRVLQVGLSDRQREATVAHLREAFAWVMGVALLLALLGGFGLTRRGLAPVRDLAHATRSAMGAGDPNARVPERDGGDELSELGRSVNRMLERNQRLVEGMRQALDNVAHDLRTPLTRLRANAELALSSEDAGAHREALADTVEESDRLLSTLRTLMDISEAETGVMRLDRTDVDLGAVAARVAELYEHVAEEQQVRLVVDAEEGAVVPADRVRIEQALANLLDNAIKYTPAGGEARITVIGAGDAVEVRVSDTGIGIPAEAQPRIWERLYRVDPSRSERGLGLGLSFVRAIVEAHGGTVGVKSTPGRGSQLTMQLPRVKV